VPIVTENAANPKASTASTTTGMYAFTVVPPPLCDLSS
jgi:hypothetical protein